MGTHTAQGYIARDFETVRDSCRKRMKDSDMLGGEADVSTPGQPVPAAIDILAEQVSLTEGSIAELSRAFDSRTATGALLEANAMLLGEAPIDAAASFLPARATGIPGTQIGARVVRFEPNATLWRVPENTVIAISGEVFFELESAEDGPIAAPVAGPAQWTLLNKPNGWNTVESVEAVRLGRFDETDAEFRVRLGSGPRGESTEPGIIAAAFALTGNSRSRFYNNRSNATDPKTGVPGKHAELLIDGASDQAVARLIYEYYCQDTGLFGNTRTVLLPENFEAWYSRPEVRRVFVRVVLHTQDAEDELPDEYVQLVQSAVQQRALTLKPSKDLYMSAFQGAIVSALPDATTTYIEVFFRWSPIDPWVSPVLAVNVRERVDIYGGPSPAILEGGTPGPFNLPPGSILALEVNGGDEFFVVFTDGLAGAPASEAAQVVGALVDSEQLIIGFRANRLVLQTVAIGPTASITVTGNSSAETLLAFGFTPPATAVGFLSDVTVEVAP